MKWQRANISAAQPNTMNPNSIYLVVGLIALIGVGAGGYFVMKKSTASLRSRKQLTMMTRTILRSPMMKIIKARYDNENQDE